MSVDVEEIKRIAQEVVDESVVGPLVELCNGIEALAVQLKHSLAPKGVLAVKEKTFDILKFEEQQGARIGAFEVASKKDNLPSKFEQAYNILHKNDATISNRYHGPAYVYSYWIYRNSIYRQRQKKA